MNNSMTPSYRGHNPYIYYAEINKLEFYVLGSEENYIDSAVSVVSKDLFKGDKPVNEGCYSPKMGTTDYGWECAHCLNIKGNCNGHSGSLDLKYPVKSPMFRDIILKWLKIICFKCGRLLITKELNIPSPKILGEYVRLAKIVNNCPWPDCGEYHPSVSKDKFRQQIFYAEYREGGIVRKEELYNNHIRDILNKISNDTLRAIGVTVKSHPKNFILDIIRIPPNTIRPDIRKVGGNRSNNSDITALSKSMVEINELLNKEIPNNTEITNRLSEMYFNLDMTYHNMIKGSSSTNNQVRMVTTSKKAPTPIAQRFPKKEGRLRNNLMGKRVKYMLRSVLSGDNYLAIDEVGIPVMMARKMPIPETVQFYNIHRMNTYYKNKRDIYPGCAGVYIKATKKYYKIDILDPSYELKYGDIVYRDMIDGDPVVVNRQPSLLTGQASNQKAKIMHVGNTIRINVSACAPYNADFDGDAVNCLVPQNIQSRSEVARMSWIGNWMVSYQNHSPYFGCFQDSLIGSAELTKSNINFDKYHAMLLFSNIKSNDQDCFNFDKKMYSGRDVVSKFLPKINYPKKKASIYMPQYAPFIKYDPDDIYVQINRGQLISGILDKSTCGQGVMGSIFHIINNEYGANAALDTIHNFHQITSRFFLWRGFTVGIKDINISESALLKVREQTIAMEEEAKKITEKLNNRELVSPIGIKLSEFYEKAQLNALEPADSFVIPIINDINFSSNKLARLIFTGSKGKKTNLININGSYGQITINGQRPQRNFSWGRTSPYFLRYDTSPASLGFVATSYREGISPDQFPFAAGDARHSSTLNALSTSKSGAQSRTNVKNLESDIINNLRQTVKDDNIVQILYAESGVDTRKTEAVKFLTITISDKEMEDNYKSTLKYVDKKYHNKDVQRYLDEEYKQLLEDRAVFREIFLWAENNNPGQYILDPVHQMPINPYRIIEDVVYNYEDSIDGLSKDELLLDPVATIEKVRQLCDDIPYMYFNSYYEKRRGRIPIVYKTATTLLCILIRSYLNIANLYRRKINNYHLDLIINKIKITFKNSLVDYGSAVGVIAAQCLSEPLTQYVLDSKHRSGTGQGTTINVVERFKEILGSRPTEDIKSPSMLIMVLPEYEKDKLKVQEIANYIEMMDFEKFISNERIFFEEYGNPIHPDYKHEIKMIKDFERNNAGIRIPGNLTKWCIRYEINKEELIINSMKLDTIIIKLGLRFPDMFLVYTAESANKIIIRAYIPQSMIKIPQSGFNESIIQDIAVNISNTIIRGIKNITYAEVTSIAKSEVDNDGSIKISNVYGITTAGTNLEEVLENEYVDKYRTQTNSITEFEEMYGIEAARQKIITEIRKTMSSDNVIREHTSIFADEMTYSGKTTSIQRTGLQVRERNNVSLRLSFQSPVQVIEQAAINNLTDDIYGVSGPLINGQAPQLGTIYNDVFLDEGFVMSHLKNLSKNIEDEL